jgi:hypothetical protein
LPVDVDPPALAWAVDEEAAAGLADTCDDAEAAVGDAALPAWKAANLAATLALMAARASGVAYSNHVNLG